MATPLAQRLRLEISNKETNARELAIKAEVGASFVYDILNGKSKNPTIHKLAAIAESLGTTVAYLLYGDDYNNMHPEKDSNLKAVPLMIAKYDDSSRKISIESVEGGEVQYFNKSWIETSLQAKPDDMRVIHVLGDGMSPTLHDNDIVLIDVSKKEATQSGMFAIFDGKGLMVKRLEFVIDRVRVTSDNERYSSYEVSPAEIDIIGRVVWFSRKI